MKDSAVKISAAHSENASFPVVRLRPGRERSLLRRHPWVFSGAVAAEPRAESGAVVRVESANGGFLAWGFWSPESQLRVRALSFSPDEVPNRGLLLERLRAAGRRRDALRDLFPVFRDCTAMRLVHGESDGLPGLVVDRYGSILSVQILCAGFERMRSELAETLLEAFPDVTAAYERSDAKARAREGLGPSEGLLAARGGDAAESGLSSETVRTVRFGGEMRRVDVVGGQKTGTYLDQAVNHPAVGALASGKDVLDVCCCDGGFTVACLRGGAKSVLSLDSSEVALSALRDNLAANGIEDADRCQTVRADAFSHLRTLRDGRRSFDLIVLDPPKLAETRGRVEKACRAYKDLNLLAFKLLRPGGMLATFSCSGAVDPALFRTVVAEAASDAGVDARVLRTFLQSPDHPVSLSFPEGLYLKGLLCRI